VRTEVRELIEMKRSIGLAVFALMIMSFGLVAQEKTTEYYPLKEGSKWTYTVMGSQITMKVGKQEKVGEVMCWKIATIVNDKEVASEHISVTDDGIYRNQLNTQKPDAPVCFLKLPPKKDAKWEVNTKIQGQVIKGTFIVRDEKIKAGGKDYDTFVSEGKDIDINGKLTTIKYWFAKDVGIVKLSFTMDGQETVLELEKYEAAK